MSSELLQNLAKTIGPLLDLRFKQGVTYPCHGLLFVSTGKFGAAQNWNLAIRDIL